MRRSAIFVVLALGIVGCGGNDSAMSSPGSGLYGAPARDSRERDNLVNAATKELAKGPAAKVAEAASNFGYKLLAQSPGEGNVIVSPLSISSALAMTLNGAAGETQREMLGAIGLDKMTPPILNDASKSIRNLLGNVDPSVELQVANSIWAKDGAPFKDAFLQVNEDAYGAKMTRLDFDSPNAPDAINQWVKQATGGKIEKMVDRIPGLSRMFLMNAVYFKGQWRMPFAKESTQEGVFTTANGDKRKVPFMTGTMHVSYAEEKGWKAVALPYGNGRIEMLVLLPSGSVDDLIKNFAEKGVPKALSDAGDAEVALKLPKFRSEFEMSLNEPLKKLGMKKAFTDSADFSGMSDEKLLISEVKHKTFIEVDEQGTEAAASTGVQMQALSAKVDKPKEFTVDRPFLFAIREKQTGIVLFLGAVKAIGEAAKP